MRFAEVGAAGFQNQKANCTMLSFNEKSKLRDDPLGCSSLFAAFEILAELHDFIL